MRMSLRGNGDGLLGLLWRGGQNGVEDQRADDGAILAAAEAGEPGARVVKVKLPERFFDLLIC